MRGSSSSPSLPSATAAVIAATMLAGAGCGTGGTTRAAAGPPPPAAPPPALTTPARAAPQPPAGPVLLAPADVDRLMRAAWAAAGVTPGTASDDAEFLRRATLDTVGRVPTLEEAEPFLADPRPDKRTRLIDTLLASPDYAEHWADVAVDLYIGRQFRKPGLEKRLDPRAFFVDVYRANRPYDRVAREMLTFTGEIVPSGPGVFLISHLRGGGPEVTASATARLFLGVQIQCAQCHDHPYDARYKQDDFYGLVAYFARTRQKEEKMEAPVSPGPESKSSGPENKRYFINDRPKGKTTFKRPGMGAAQAGGAAPADEVVALPRFLGRDVAPLPGEAPRDTLARAVIGSDLFAKTLVDRLWAQLFGRGLVEPWDDLGGEGDPKHPELLVRLADDFRASGYDFKHLLRLMLLSQAYALSSRGPTDAAAPATAPAPVAETAPPAPAAPPASTAVTPPTIARAAVRRLTPEQLFRSLLVATGAEHVERDGQKDPTLTPEQVRDKVQDKIDKAMREVMFVFGDDEMAEVDAFNGNIPQALLLWNGDVTNQGARARPGSTLARILAASPVPAERLRRIFLTAYARPPTADEAARLLPALTPAPGVDTRAACEDLFFALLTSSEMLTNH
jgi:Protein of unknown function (DUF1549)/Protein of unknown function (DUF1553)